MRDLASRSELCCMNTATLGYREPIDVTAARIAAAGFGCITPWRQEIDEDRPERAAAAIRACGLRVAGYCRTAYFAADDAAGRVAAIASNRRAVEAAAVLGAPMLVAVVGGLAPGSRDVPGCRQQILDGLAELLPTMRACGVRIALEPLHPYYAADRSLLNTIAQALDWCERLDPANEAWFGIAVDAYHVWWDPDLEASIERAAGRILALHVCDWLRETRDPAARPRDDGRRRHRPAAPARRSRGDRVRRSGRGRDLLDARLVAARPRRGASGQPRTPRVGMLRSPSARRGCCGIK